MATNIQIRNKDESSYSMVCKDHIRYLGVMIND